MHTGGGKTLCMFLPPLAMGPMAMGLMISPLVALIDQQVSILYMLDMISAFHISSYKVYQVRQLRQVGVSAVHAVRTDQCKDVSLGKYHFGGSIMSIGRCMHGLNYQIMIHALCLCHLRLCG